MDYEKAYKAVLKTATQWIKDGCSDKEKICLECVFPELRESDDERIRRGIIQTLEFACAHKLVGVDDVLKMKAYLEKQKEQKPVECSEEEERLINTSISFLKDFADKGYENAVECIDWLKSLQPHCRPSKEQPEVFDTVAFQKGVQEGRRLEREDALTD